MDINESQVVEICRKCNFDFINFQLLGTGAFNVNYLLITKQGKFVLRIENNVQFQKKKQEYEILKSLKGKFGPKVYFFDDSKKIIQADFLVEEFIEFGDHPPSEASDDFIETMGKWYRSLHRIKSKISDVRDYSKFYLIETFEYDFNTYRKNKQVLEIKFQKIIEKLFEKASKIIERNNSVFSKRKFFSLIHGDPTRSNIFYSDNSVKLVDWEMARYQVREWDLAFFVWSYELVKKKKLAFLKYANYPLLNFTWKQFETIYLLHCFGMLAWKIERLRLIKDGKIDRDQTSSTIDEVMDGISDDIQIIETALENPFL